MLRKLGRRPWLLFGVAVLACAAYVSFLDWLPQGAWSKLRGLPWVWAIPAAATFAAYLVAWRGDAIPSWRKYLHAAGYGFWAPLAALLLLGLPLAWRQGFMP